jgi:hypothetical protein
MRTVLILEAEREGYGIDQVRGTMTVGELIEFLSDYDESAEIYLSHDNGYTYGGITIGRFSEKEYDEEADELTDI